MTEASPEIVQQQITEKSAGLMPLVKRIGCGLMLIVWFGILLLPCAMFWLGTGGTIRISHANVPEPESHPAFAINLIMETQNRGLQFTRTRIIQIDEQKLCIEGHVDYLLWESNSSATSATYCQCYQRSGHEEDWQFLTQTSGSCNP